MKRAMKTAGSGWGALRESWVLPVVAALCFAVGGSCARKPDVPAEVRFPTSDLDIPTERLTGEADYDRARSLVTHGKTESARLILEEKTREPKLDLPDLQADRSEFLLGVLALRDGYAEKALGHLQSISFNYDRLVDYQLWFTAKAHHRLEHPAKARDALTDLIARYPDSIWRDKAFYLLLEIVDADDDFDAGAELVTDLALSGWLESGAFREKPGPALHMMARQLDAAGKKREALELLEWLYTDYAGTEEALELRPVIASLREELGLEPLVLTPEQRLSRVKQLYRATELDAALSEANALIRAISPERGIDVSDQYIDAIAWKGRVYEGKGESSKAARLYRKAVELGYDRDGTFQFRLAKIASRSSNKRAIHDYLMLVKHLPGSSLAPQALYTAARLAQISDNDKLAMSLFGRLLDEYPRDKEWVPLAYFNEGWIAFRDKDYAVAERAFQSLADRFPDSDEYHRALYWAGRAAAMDRGRQAGRVYMERLLSERPASYYGMLARSWIEGRSFDQMLIALSNREKGVDHKLPENHAVNESEQWLMAQADAYEWKRADAVANAAELIALGLLKEAENELDRAVESNEGKDAWRAIVPLYKRAGAWRAAQRLAFRIDGGRPPSVAEENRNHWEVLYPLGFSTFVDQYAHRNGIDPHLVLSIIREESHFDAAITSWADARGLMQIIPPTGRQIASAHRVKDFDPEQLYDPETNIRFGTYYLAKLVRRFGGNPVLAIASYNGGPHNVDKWKRRNGHLDLDVFVEEIPFHETRNYVKKVYRSWGLYRTLYGGEDLASRFSDKTETAANR